MKHKIRVCTILVMALALAAPALAQDGRTRLRIVNAAPEAPALDILLDDGRTFGSAPYNGASQYATLPSGAHSLRAVAGDATGSAVVSTTLDLNPGADYTVVTLGGESGEALVLTDDNRAPPAGQALIRFVHASANAPRLDIVVTGGDRLFDNVAFKGVTDYLPIAPGTYDLEVRVAGTSEVGLYAPDVGLAPGRVYTFFATGVVGAEPVFQLIPVVDVVAASSVLPGTGEWTGITSRSYLIASLLGLALLAAGLVARMRGRQPAHERRAN
jgi:hypothetical protein